MKQINIVLPTPTFLTVALSIGALASIVAGVFMLAERGWGFVAAGVAAFVLQWLLSPSTEVP